MLEDDEPQFMKFTALQEHKEKGASMRKFTTFREFESRTNVEDAGRGHLFSQLTLFKSHHNTPVQLKDNLKDKKPNNENKKEGKHLANVENSENAITPENTEPLVGIDENNEVDTNSGPVIKYEDEPDPAIENTEPVDNVDWIEIIERKPVMHILLSVAKKVRPEAAV